MLFLIRGLPGSGKSTYAKSLKKGMDCMCIHVEADMFFTDVSGNYNYNPEKVVEAHEWCQRVCMDALNIGAAVIVANTFTRIREMQPYMDMATDLGIPYAIVHVIGNFQNIHGVPEEVIEKMRERWEPCAEEYEIEFCGENNLPNLLYYSR